MRRPGALRGCAGTIRCSLVNPFGIPAYRTRPQNTPFLSLSRLLPLPTAGVAFQLIDDLLDYQGTAVSLGKPALADIKAGLATAPVLFAAQQFPVLLPLIERKFEAPGDVDAALRFVAAADGLTATRRLAIAHGQLALDELAVLAPSPARTALAALVSRVLNRTR